MNKKMLSVLALCIAMQTQFLQAISLTPKEIAKQCWNDFKESKEAKFIAVGALSAPLGVHLFQQSKLKKKLNKYFYVEHEEIIQEKDQNQNKDDKESNNNNNNNNNIKNNSVPEYLQNEVELFNSLSAQKTLKNKIQAAQKFLKGENENLVFYPDALFTDFSVTDKGDGVYEIALKSEKANVTETSPDLGWVLNVWAKEKLPAGAKELNVQIDNLNQEKFFVNTELVELPGHSDNSNSRFSTNLNNEMIKKIRNVFFADMFKDILKENRENLKFAFFQDKGALTISIVEGSEQATELQDLKILTKELEWSAKDAGLNKIYEKISFAWFGNSNQNEATHSGTLFGKEEE